MGWCFLCRCNGKSVAHLLLHCDVTFGLWVKAFDIFGTHWVMGRVVADLSGWWNWLGKQCSDIWNLVPLCLTWTVWKERNRCTFENMELTRDDLANIFFPYSI